MKASLALDLPAVKAFLKSAGDQKIGYDIETSSLEPRSGYVVGVSLGYLRPKPTAIYIPLRHEKGPNAPTTFVELMGIVLPLDLVVFNGLFEGKWDWAKLKKMRAFAGDAAILLRMLQLRVFGLKDAMKKFDLGEATKLSSLISGDDYNFAKLDSSDPKVLEYVCCDAINALLLESHLAAHKTIEKSRDIYELELNVQPILARAEAQGMAIDMSDIRVKIDQFKRRIDETAGEIFLMMRVPQDSFKLNSYKKLAHQLFDVMGIKPNRMFRTKSGWSTKTAALKAIEDSHPVIPLLIEWKHMFYVWNNNLTKIHEHVANGRLYTHFEPIGADATSRIYTKSANATALPSEVRACVKEKGRKIVHYDFIGAELCIMAAMSGEDVLVDAFMNGKDIHKAVYSRMTGVPEDQITREQREVGKVCNYSLLYGGTAFTLARNLGISEAEAKPHREKYFAALPKLTDLLQHLKDVCARTTYTKTMMGRRRRLPEAKSRSGSKVAHALRQAVNTAGQSSCGDFLKKSILQVYTEMAMDPDKWADVYMISPVFDSCAFSVPDELVDDFVTLLKSAAPVQMPIKDTSDMLTLGADVEVDDDWGYEKGMLFDDE